MATDSSERGSQAIHRTLRILECFTLASPTVSLTELTRQTGLTMSTAHRIVKALQRTEFLTQDPLTNRYALGPEVMRLARVIMARAGDPDNRPFPTKRKRLRATSSKAKRAFL